MPCPDNLRMNILLISTPVSFSFLAPFLFFAAHKEKAGQVGGKGSIFIPTWPLESWSCRSAPPSTKGVSQILTLPFRVPEIWRKSGRSPSLAFSQFRAIRLPQSYLFHVWVSVGLLFSKYFSLNGSLFISNTFKWYCTNQFNLAKIEIIHKHIHNEINMVLFNSH